MQSGLVTPFAGVWIEIMLIVLVVEIVSVTPFAGVWIEITAVVKAFIVSQRSPPSRGCGLKYYEIGEYNLDYVVTPFAGVWIEIELITGCYRNG